MKKSKAKNGFGKTLRFKTSPTVGGSGVNPTKYSILQEWRGKGKKVERHGMEVFSRIRTHTSVYHDWSTNDIWTLFSYFTWFLHKPSKLLSDCPSLKDFLVVTIENRNWKHYSGTWACYVEQITNYCEETDYHTSHHGCCGDHFVEFTDYWFLSEVGHS